MFRGLLANYEHKLNRIEALNIVYIDTFKIAITICFCSFVEAVCGNWTHKLKNNQIKTETNENSFSLVSNLVWQYIAKANHI